MQEFHIANYLADSFFKTHVKKSKFLQKEILSCLNQFLPPLIKNGATVPYPSFTSNEAASPHPPATQWDLSCTCSSSHD